MSFLVCTRRLFGAVFVVIGVVCAFGICAIAMTDRAGAAALVQSVASAISCSSTGTSSCFSATNTSSGIGVYGTSKSGTGLRGLSTSNYGLKATSTSGVGVYGQSSSGTAGVVGTMASGTGVYGYTTSSSFGTGVEGSSNAGTGVYGTSSKDTGVYGSSNGTNGTAVYGGTTASGGTGVQGESDEGYGVAGTSSDGVAIFGNSSEGGSGVYAGSKTGVALFAFSGPASGGFTTSNNFAIRAVGQQGGVLAEVASTDTGLNSFESIDYNNGNTTFYVDGAGDLFYSGKLQTTAHTQGGSIATAFATKTTAPTMEDTGTGQLVGGASAVRLDPTFAATIDTSTPYRVFLTPAGDSRGLYVASRSNAGFIVRESQGGRSSMSFDYRIVAAPIGQVRDRMALVGRDALRSALSGHARMSHRSFAPPRTPLRPRLTLP